MTAASKLPVTVTAVVRYSGSLWAVTVAYNDGTTGTYLIPDSMATIQAVTISALAMAVVTDLNVNQLGVRNPLTGTYSVGTPG